MKEIRKKEIANTFLIFLKKSANWGFFLTLKWNFKLACDIPPMSYKLNDLSVTQTGLKGEFCLRWDYIRLLVEAVKPAMKAVLALGCSHLHGYQRNFWLLGGGGLLVQDVGGQSKDCLHGVELKWALELKRLRCLEGYHSKVEETKDNVHAGKRKNLLLAVWYVKPHGVPLGWCLVLFTKFGYFMKLCHAANTVCLFISTLLSWVLFVVNTHITLTKM